jgi:hypothetical protein
VLRNSRYGYEKKRACDGAQSSGQNGRQQENGNVAIKQMENGQVESFPWLGAGWGEKNIFFDFFLVA